MILVVGATGNIGSRLVQRLGDRARAFVRDPLRISTVETFVGDLTRPESLRPALEGVDGVFLVFQMANERFAPEVIGVVAEHATRAVYVSSYTVDDDAEEQAHPMTAFHARVEDELAGSGLEWTSLRCTSLATNNLGWAEEIRADRPVTMQYLDVHRSHIHEDDVAAVAERVLLDVGHGGQRYVLSGSDSISERERFRIIGDVIGREVELVELGPDGYRELLIAEGTDPAVIAGALVHQKKLLDEPEPVTDTVERLTGRPPSTFRAWVEEHTAAFSGV